MDKKKSFHSGEICEESGVYELKNHEHLSKEQIQIPLAKGNRFPPCRDCKVATIEWVLVRKA